MTTASLENAAPTTKLVEPDTDSRLAALVAQYDLAKAEAKKADEALKAITDGIKAELVHAAPGSHDIRVDSPDLAQPLRLFPVTSQRINTKRLKAEQPAVYDAYTEPSTAWQLRAVSL